MYWPVLARDAQDPLSLTAIRVQNAHAHQDRRHSVFMQWIEIGGQTRCIGTKAAVKIGEQLRTFFKHEPDPEPEPKPEEQMTTGFSVPADDDQKDDNIIVLLFFLCYGLIALSYLFDNGNLADAPFDHAFDRNFEAWRPVQCVLNYCGVYGVTPNRLFQLLGFNAKSSATEEKSLVKVSQES